MQHPSTHHISEFYSVRYRVSIQSNHKINYVVKSKILAVLFPLVMNEAGKVVTTMNCIPEDDFPIAPNSISGVGKINYFNLGMNINCDRDVLFPTNKY